MKVSLATTGAGPSCWTPDFTVPGLGFLPPVFAAASLYLAIASFSVISPAATAALSFRPNSFRSTDASGVSDGLSSPPSAASLYFAIASFSVNFPFATAAFSSTASFSSSVTESRMGFVPSVAFFAGGDFAANRVSATRVNPRATWYRCLSDRRINAFPATAGDAMKLASIRFSATSWNSRSAEITEIRPSLLEK